MRTKYLMVLAGGVLVAAAVAASAPASASASALASVAASAASTTPTGITGVQRVEQPSASNSNAAKSAIAQCTGTQKVINASGYVTDGSTKVLLDQVTPSPDLTEVTVAAKETDVYTANWTVTAVATCADPPSGPTAQNKSVLPMIQPRPRPRRWVAPTPRRSCWVPGSTSSVAPASNSAMRIALTRRWMTLSSVAEGSEPRTTWFRRLSSSADNTLGLKAANAASTRCVIRSASLPAAARLSRRPARRSARSRNAASTATRCGDFRDTRYVAAGMWRRRPRSPEPPG
jgi:hypothetical protein